MTLRGHLAHFAARRQDQPDLKHSSETLAQPVFKTSEKGDSSPTAGLPSPRHRKVLSNASSASVLLQSKPINSH